MGWFGSLCSSISSGIKAVGRKIGEGIEDFGTEIGSEKLAQVGRNIQDVCAEKISEEEAYEKNTANIYSTDRLNEILVTFSEGYYQQATAIENACIESVENYYEAIIQLLEDSSDKVKSNANLKRVRRAKTKIAGNIKGAIKEPLAKRMSLDDSECLAILKMDSGEEKRKAMTLFTQKIIQSALENLAEKVRNSLEEQMEWIEDYLINMSEEQEKAFSNLKKQYTKMVK